MEMYISDTHLGHENILEERRDRFSTLEEMNDGIIDAINRRMTRGDLLYIVGDFAFRSKTDPREFLERIKPRKILIMGNHDRDWLRHLSDEEIAHYFVGVYDRYSFKRNGIEVHFDHFPRLAWSRSHYFAGSFSVCGHIHARRDEPVAARLFAEVDCQFNAGVDVNGFEPVSFARLVANNTAFYGRSYTEEQRALLDSAIAKVMG